MGMEILLQAQEGKTKMAHLAYSPARPPVAQASVTATLPAAACTTSPTCLPGSLRCRRRWKQRPRQRPRSLRDSSGAPNNNSPN